MDRIDSGLSQSVAPQQSSSHPSEPPGSEALSRAGALGRPGRPPADQRCRAGFRPWGWLAAVLFLLAAAIHPAQAQSPAPVVFGVYRLLWTGLNPNLGNTLDMLTNTIDNPSWPDNPDPAYTMIFTNFETEVNSGLNYYGQQVRAFVVPPTNGNYLFWIASDDASELFVSTDETPANKAPAAWVGDYSWTPAEDWTKYPSQQSAPIPLEAGRRYYLEALMQQGSGGDNLSVRWQLPDGTYEEPMAAVSQAGTLLLPFDGFDVLPGIYQQTTNLMVVEASNVGLSVLVTNSSPVTYAWLLKGASLLGPNAAKPFYNVSNVSVALNNGQVYSCVVSNSAGAVTSAPVLLTVIRDTNPPTVAVVGNVGATNVQVFFSKTVELASAANAANYAFTNGLRVTAASLGPDNVTVTLTTAPLVYGSNYTLVINHVRDRASVPNTIAANTTVSFLATVYAALDIGKPSVPSVVTPVGTGGLDVSSAGTQVGGAADQFSFNYQFRAGDFDVAVRLAGMVPSDVWAKAGLMARESLLPSGRFAAALATPAMVGSCFEWRDPAGSQANSTGTFPPNYPDTWLRLKRTGLTFTGFAGYDGQTWVQLGWAAITMPAQIYLGFAASSHNAAQPTLVQFRDLATATTNVVAAPPNPHEPLGPCSRRTALVISEIMYKPAPRADLNNLEFLELYNTNPWFQDIGGYQVVANDMSYTFPAGTVLNGGAFLVIAASPPSIQTVYGITNVVGPYLGSLKSKGTIQLLDDLGAVLLSIPYSNVRPWPVAADGTGHSLVLANPTYGEAQPQAWDISDVLGGSPGQGEAYRPSPLRNVLINEVLA
ncbi:MAG: lamin tail domain-containing protein, partial [Verrucomicrobiota bacterium]